MSVCPKSTLETKILKMLCDLSKGIAWSIFVCKFCHTYRFFKLDDEFNVYIYNFELLILLDSKSDVEKCRKIQVEIWFFHQAGTMAHMQLEVEKELNKKVPNKNMVWTVLIYMCQNVVQCKVKCIKGMHISCCPTSYSFLWCFKLMELILNYIQNG